MTRDEQLLDRLETSIRRLKLDYDIFFNGGIGHFPQKAHAELDAEIKRLFNVPTMTYAQKFRLNSLATRLSVYNGLWQRSLRLVEQGLSPIQGAAPVWRPQDRFEIPIASETDREAIEILLEAFSRAREFSGNDAPIDPLKFEQFIATRLREEKEKKGCTEVVFIVSTEDGEVHLKTRAQS